MSVMRYQSTSAVTRKVPQHREDIHRFADFAVNAVIQRLVQEEHELGGEYSNAAIEHRLLDVLEPMTDRYDIDTAELAASFAYRELERIVDDCRQDANRYPIQDPALESLEEVYYASNGFQATVAYRIANTLLRLRVPLLPRTISGLAHSRTGVDIHPGTTIAPGLFIDHGTGIAIGCTAVIGSNVNLYNGVVLGTRSKPKRRVEAATGTVQKRHPTIESGVSLYTSCFVGGDVVIGADSVIGAFAFVCRDIESGTMVQGKVETPPEAESIKQPVAIGHEVVMHGAGI